MQVSDAGNHLRMCRVVDLPLVDLVLALTANISVHSKFFSINFHWTNVQLTLNTEQRVGSLVVDALQPGSDGGPVSSSSPTWDSWGGLGERAKVRVRQLSTHEAPRLCTVMSESSCPGHVTGGEGFDLTANILQDATRRMAETSENKQDDGRLAAGGKAKSSLANV